MVLLIQWCVASFRVGINKVLQESGTLKHLTHESAPQQAPPLALLCQLSAHFGYVTRMCTAIRQMQSAASPWRRSLAALHKLIMQQG